MCTANERTNKRMNEWQDRGERKLNHKISRDKASTSETMAYKLRTKGLTYIMARARVVPDSDARKSRMTVQIINLCFVRAQDLVLMRRLSPLLPPPSPPRAGNHWMQPDLWLLIGWQRAYKLNVATRVEHKNATLSTLMRFIEIFPFFKKEEEWWRLPFKKPKWYAPCNSTIQHQTNRVPLGLTPAGRQANNRSRLNLIN